MRKLLVGILLSCALLAACGKEPAEVEVVEEVVPPLHEVVSEVNWDNHVITAITPTTAFVTDNDGLKIYPFNDLELYITVEKFYNSENEFWDIVFSDYKDSDNFVENSKYKLYTANDNVTHCIVRVEDSTYHIYGKVLSGYIEKVATQLCQSNT